MATRGRTPADPGARQGTDLLLSGKFAEAERVLREVVGRDPRNAVACSNLGVALKSQGRLVEAIECYRRALAVRGDDPNTWNNLGNALKLSGQHDEALASFRRAIGLKHDHVDAHFNLGNALLDGGEVQQAIVTYRRLLGFAPRHRWALEHLGAALKRSGNAHEAIAFYEKALALDSNVASTHRRLGDALEQTGRFEEAVVAYRRSLELEPKDAETRASYGGVLTHLLRFDEAIAELRRASAVDPECVLAHLNLGITLLAHGDFAEGWKEYEWRVRSPVFGEPVLARYPNPRWTGEDLSGRSIVVLHEQGFGDTIQFVRYAILLARRAQRVVVSVAPELLRLARGIPGIEFITVGDPLPDCDYCAYLLSLPLAFGTTAETVPAEIPYLHADPARAKWWRQRAGGDAGFKVGLVWAGKATYREDDRRSLRLADLAPFGNAPRTSFYSLQIGAPGEQARRPPEGMRLTDWSADLNDFAETAALIESLDLLISADTAAAHLAGALGKPVWLLSRHDADWRWLTGREDSPWYPTMRIFRQKTRGDWKELIERVALALAAHVTARRA